MPDAVLNAPPATPPAPPVPGAPPVTPPISPTPAPKPGETPSGTPPEPANPDPSAGKAPEPGAPKADDKGAQPSAPEKYEDFKLPEGIVFQPKDVDAFKAEAKELGLTQAAAQRLIDFQGKLAKQNADDLEADFKAQKAEWAAETVKVLGPTHAEQMAYAAKVRDTLGNPELTQLLKDTGLENRKEVVQFFIKVGKSISEDKLDEGSRTAAQPESLAKRMYPNLPSAQDKK